MKKFLLLFYFFVATIFVVPQVAFADTQFTVSNMNFNSTSGDFSFDYDAGGTTLNHQITLRQPYDASSFNYDVEEGNFTCTSTHCSGTYTGDKTNFTCTGADYRVMSTVNVTQQYTSNSLSAEQFSKECFITPTPTVTPTPSPVVTLTPTPSPTNNNHCKKITQQKLTYPLLKNKKKSINIVKHH